MKGKIYDAEKKSPMQFVEIYNIYTKEATYSDSLGNFEIKANDGELVEFKMLGYKITRIRINGQTAKYYNIGMILGPIELDELNVYQRNKTYQVDSIHTAEVFKKAIELQKLEGYDAFQHPLSALSKDNRRIWAFQERYYKTEREKYVNYVFNDKLIQELTKLGKDSIDEYKVMFSPTYEELTYWTEYEYYIYIKQSVASYRNNVIYYRQNKIND